MTVRLLSYRIEKGEDLRKEVRRKNDGGENERKKAETSTFFPSSPSQSFSLLSCVQPLRSFIRCFIMKQMKSTPKNAATQDKHGFCRMKHIGVLLSTLPWTGCLSIAGLPPKKYVSGTHLYSWGKRDIMAQILNNSKLAW